MNLKAKNAENLPKTVMAELQKARSERKKIVLATGVFDLIHSEHKNFLEKARKAGDFLVVGIESDKRVRELKGNGRPLNSESVRLKNVSDLVFVDCAFILPDDFGKTGQPRALIAAIRPQILAVSSHSPYLDKKNEILKEFGGRVEIVHRHNQEVSTTKILEKLHGDLKLSQLTKG